MRRWPKVLLAALAALALLLILNAVVLDRQTKSAEVTVDGGEILRLPGGDLQVLDVDPVLVDEILPAGEPPPPPPAPIVLLNCFTCSINWWNELIPELQREGHGVIAIDLLGHGGSEKPGSGYSIADQAQLVSGALGQLDVEGAIVAGHSLGGAVAVALAEQSPELVGGTVILDTAPDTSYGGLGLLARAAFTSVIGEALWRVKMDWSVRSGLEEAFAPGYEVPDQFVEDVKRMTYSSYDDSHSAFDSYVGESALDERLRPLDLPLLVTFGAEEQIVDDPREALSAYADVPGAETELVAGAGHSPNVEKPDETARLILRFARSVRGGSEPARNRPATKKVQADCDSITIAGAGDPRWRKRSTVAGSFGLYGSGRDLSTAEKLGDSYETKIPAILEGRDPVTLRVPRGETGTVGLLYGRTLQANSIEDSAASVRFVPCPDKPRTTWPGGLRLADREPIRLEVVAGDVVKKIRVG